MDCQGPGRRVATREEVAAMVQAEGYGAQAQGRMLEEGRWGKVMISHSRSVLKADRTPCWTRCSRNQETRGGSKVSG